MRTWGRPGRCCEGCGPGLVVTAQWGRGCRRRGGASGCSQDFALQTRLSNSSDWSAAATSRSTAEPARGLRPQTFLSQGSGGWKPNIQDASRVLGRPPFLARRQPLSLCSWGLS